MAEAMVYHTEQTPVSDRYFFPLISNDGDVKYEAVRRLWVFANMYKLIYRNITGDVKAFFNIIKYETVHEMKKRNAKNRMYIFLFF